ncbi:MAG: hypothetical protein J6Y95_04745 [Lachnospiraceae bacterium]|nr:hypothetical protein [Lachnospiraceae bacterium]
MAHYTQQQIQKILNEIDTIPIKYVVKAIRQGDLEFEKIAKLRDAQDRLADIQEALRTTPDEEEQQLWFKAVRYKEEEDEPGYVSCLKTYIAAYQKALPPGNHVQEAIRDLQEISDRKAREVWDAVDKNDIYSLSNFLRRHPDSSFAQTADTQFWNLCQGAGIDSIRTYREVRPNGQYADLAENLISSYEQWESVKAEEAPLLDKVDHLKSYIIKYPSSPFINEAKEYFAQKKEELFADMRENMMAYDRALVLAIVNKGIVTKEELCERGLASESSFDKMKEMLNPVEQNEVLKIASEPGVTDVFLFGIPSSGKTCVLTGLLASSAWSIDFAGNSRDYMNYLITACRKGLVPAGTISGYTTLIKATVKETVRGKLIYHPVNLVEMPGEDFLNKMVLNPNGTMDLDDMGIGASDLLGNNNPKAIFLVIDPSATGMVDVDVTAPDGSITRRTIAQDLILRNMISLIMKNEKIMKNVDTISFIMTKADTIQPASERQRVALDLIKNYYQTSVDDLTTFCKRLGINRNKNKDLDGHPELFLFSLGDFYPGGVYDYDSKDADALIERIKQMTRGQKEEGPLDFLKKLFNS